jgi:hypothetical protein
MICLVNLNMRRKEGSGKMAIIKTEFYEKRNLLVK